ncbi:30S ribosomal protein S11 [Patescibacteria group bacterium]
MKDTKKAAPKPKKRKQKRMVPQGRAYIQATYNNTLITITDQSGNTLAWSSAGHIGFKGPKKSTPYAAGSTVKDVLSKVHDMGLKRIDVFVKGVGSGREAAIRSLGASGITINAIKDTTPIPHNGCRQPKPRRV